MQNGSCIITHFVEFVDAANAVITEYQCTTKNTSQRKLVIETTRGMQNSRDNHRFHWPLCSSSSSIIIRARKYVFSFYVVALYLMSNRTDQRSLISFSFQHLIHALPYMTLTVTPTNSCTHAVITDTRNSGLTFAKLAVWFLDLL